MGGGPKTLEQVLVERGLLKEEELKALKAQADQRKTTVEAVIRKERILSDETLAQVRAELGGIPYVDLSKIKPKSEAMQGISRQAAASYRFVAFDERGDKLLVAMEEPDNFQALQAVRFVAKRRGLIPEIHLGSKEGIDRLLGMTAEIQAEIGGALKEFSRDLSEARIDNTDEKALEQLIEEAPVSKVVAVIIRHAVEGKASDIHIEPTSRELRIRYRVDGRLHTSLLLPNKIQTAVVSRIKILSNLKIDESRLPQDGRFSTSIDGRNYDFRVAIMPVSYGEKVVLRILAKAEKPPSFDELGLWGMQQKIFKQHIHLPNGIVLISGPTGSGKSTTLFTSLSGVNSPEVNIATLEDPVEYEIEGVNQTQIHAEIGLSFASGLRALLRQDPNVLMVGEIRDKETAELAVHAALTGHVVLSTIHTNDAIGVVPRLVDMGIDPFLLTATLRLLVAQRLVIKLCPECKQQIPIPENIKEQLVKQVARIPDKYKEEENQKNPQFLYESPGCSVCHDSGSSGRLGIFEVIPITKAFRSAITESPEYDTLDAVARQEQCLSLQQDGLLKALGGHIKYEDVMRVTAEEENIS